MEICILIYFLIGFFVMNNDWKKNHEKEYKELKRKKDVDKGMAMIYMMCVTLLWPIVLIKNLFFNNVK